MSITFKQIEAFYWIAELGSVGEAAQRLNLAQSTVSKRILELEAILNVPLLDRSSRAARLTRIAHNLAPIAGDLLRLGQRFREAAAGPLGFSGPFRFGVTETVALTWLPKLIVAMKEIVPDVIPEPEVDSSVSLFHKLAERRIDLVIGLDPPTNAGFTTLPLGGVTLQWMSAPGVGPSANRLSLAEIANYPILTQGEGSGLQSLVVEWLHANGVRFDRIVKCNSVHILSALAIAGMGITFLNEQYFRPEIESGRLRIIRTTPALPKIQYFSCFRSEMLDPLAELIARLSQKCCDFTARGT